MKPNKTIKYLLLLVLLVALAEVFVAVSIIVAGFDFFWPENGLGFLYYLFVFAFPLVFFLALEWICLKKMFPTFKKWMYTIYFSVFFLFVCLIQIIIRKYFNDFFIDLKDGEITWGIDRIKNWYFFLLVYAWFIGAKVVLYLGNIRK